MTNVQQAWLAFARELDAVYDLRETSCGIENNLEPIDAEHPLHKAAVELQNAIGGPLPAPCIPHWRKLLRVSRMDSPTEEQYDKAYDACWWLQDYAEQQAGAVPIGGGDSPPAVDQYVTLLQMAGIVSRGKRTIRRLYDNKILPAPDKVGGNGEANEWAWSSVRPVLEAQYGRKLPRVFPTARYTGDPGDQ